MSKGGADVPRRPKSPCSYPGCPNLTDGRYCEEHENGANRSYESMAETKLYAVGMDEHGNESVTAT